MAQLTDDCFAFGGELMPVDEAVALIAERLTAIGEYEHVSLAEADGRILAQNLIAPIPLPPFTNSAVDGYAVRSRDLAGASETRLAISGRIEAGTRAAAATQANTAIRIFTGAQMPEGFDTVYMQEDVTLGEGTQKQPIVQLPGGLKPGANVRPAGEDIAAGTRVWTRK